MLPPTWPIHLLISTALEIGFPWDSEKEGWIRAVLPLLRIISGRLQHFRSVVFPSWQDKVAGDLLQERMFSCECCFDKWISPTPWLFPPEKMLLRAVLSGGVWNWFLLSKAQNEDVP